MNQIYIKNLEMYGWTAFKRYLVVIILVFSTASSNCQEKQKTGKSGPVSTNQYEGVVPRKNKSRFQEKNEIRSKPAKREQLSTKQKNAIRMLNALGYLEATMRAPAKTGVTIYDDTRTYNAFNLVLSMHAPEAVLMDMTGKILHTWHMEVTEAWPEFNPEQWLENNTRSVHWRRVHLLENGDLLVIFDGVGMVKLDKHSNLIWKAQNGAHHDLHVARDGTIYTLTRKAHIMKKYNPEEPVLEDFISVLDPRGLELRTISILELLENSHYAPVLRRLKSHGDLLHTNTIEFIEDSPADPMHPLKQNTILISIRELSFVCAVDLVEKTVYWGESDLWFRQHQPTLLKNGNILVFDNEGVKRKSSVIEYNPITGHVEWVYQGNPERPFFTSVIGSSQRLSNGNTLITESEPGHAFEVTPGKQVVWNYVNPHRAGRNPELIAILLEVVRLNNQFPTDWLNPS